MTRDELLPDCGRFRPELAALLYDELAPDARAALDQHVASCTACREELRALGETRSLLARWETPASAEDPRALARSIAAAARPTLAPPPRRARLVRWSALLSGAAAALVFALGLLSARIQYGGGRFELSFGLPGERDATALATPALREEVRTLAAQAAAEEVALRSAHFQASQEELFQRCSRMTQQELLRLSQAVDYALAQNQETWDTRLVTLGREAAKADLETRRVLTDLASYLPVSNR